MSVAAFLSELRSRDIRVWVEGDKLRCDARAGALTAELREELRSRKGDIVGFLRLAKSLAAQQDAIVPLQSAGAGAPVYAVPPHTGDVFAYRALAQALGAERPFFALQPPGLDGRAEPLARVEPLAALFAAQIRALRQPGPCIVAGFCMGAAAAFELARELRADGPPVAFLALFGAPHPDFFRPLSLFRHTLGVRTRGWHSRLKLLAAQSARERLQYVGWRLRLHRQPVDPVLAARARVEGATLAAVRAYAPRPLAIRVHHFVPCKDWAVRSRSQAGRWTALASSVQVHEGPEGCSADDMLLPPYAPGFAEQFRRACTQEGV